MCRCIPLHVRDVSHIVAREPGVRHLVGWSFLQVDEHTHVVLSVVRGVVNARAFLARSCHRGVDLAQHRLVVLYVGVDLLRGCLVVRILVEVVGTGGVQRECCCSDATHNILVHKKIFLLVIGY